MQGPLKTPVSGTAMGLIKEGKEVRILTDIQGIEDFLGDMDFKLPVLIRELLRYKWI